MLKAGISLKSLYKNMELIELQTTVERTLDLLAESGIRTKSLYAYTHTGFGCIVHTLQVKGLSIVAPTMLDEFLLEQFELSRQGKFSLWKWNLIRRSCELLKYCAAKGSIDMSPLLPWLSTLHRSWQSIPIAEQLADSENIFALVWKTNQSMVKLGLADATVRHYREERLAVILNRHYEVRIEHFYEELLNQIITEKRVQYEQG